MYYFVFHVQPRPNLEDANNIGGAYVSCWIEANVITEAEQIAIKKIDGLKWNIIEKEDSFELEPGHYVSDADGFEFYQQALIDKLVLRFHVYPKHE